MKTQVMTSPWGGVRVWTLRVMPGALLAIGLAGCVTAPRRSWESVLTPHQVAWQELPAGRVGIITTSMVPLFRVEYPLQRDDAVEEAASRGFWLGGEPGNEGVKALWLTGVGVVSLGPMVVSSLMAQGVTHMRVIPEQRRIAAMASVRRAEQRLDVQAQVARELESRLGPALGRPVVAVPKPFPTQNAAWVRRRVLLEAGTFAWLPDNISADAYLASHGIETVLEMRVLKAGLSGNPGANPNLALRIEAESRLIRRRDGMVLAHAGAMYASPAHAFLRWARSDGRLLEEEFVRACAHLGEGLAEGLLASFAGPATTTEPAPLVQTP
ncbi:MAG: hypothetical protein RJA22_146 [Verrucomicrobiota bacterium]